MLKISQMVGTPQRSRHLPTSILLINSGASISIWKGPTKCLRVPQLTCSRRASSQNGKILNTSRVPHLDSSSLKDMPTRFGKIWSWLLSVSNFNLIMKSLESFFLLEESTSSAFGIATDLTTELLHRSSQTWLNFLDSPKISRRASQSSSQPMLQVGDASSIMTKERTIIRITDVASASWPATLRASRVISHTKHKPPQLMICLNERIIVWLIS